MTLLSKPQEKEKQWLLNKNQGNKKTFPYAGIKNIKRLHFFSICGRKSMVEAGEDSRRLILPCIFSGS